MAAPLQINWSFVSKIDGGPQLSESQPVIGVTAYDYIKEVVSASSSSPDLNLPSSTTVQMVAILASKYSDKVTYLIGGAGGTKMVLNGPHIFMGSGAVAFLGSTFPAKLTFKNDSATTSLCKSLWAGRRRMPVPRWI